MLAGVAIGAFDGYEDSVARCVRVADVVTPIPENMKIYEEGFQIYREIEKAMAPIYNRAK